MGRLAQGAQQICINVFMEKLSLYRGQDGDRKPLS